MDIPAYEAALSRWIHSCRVLLEPCGEQEAVSIDGKTLRGSQGARWPSGFQECICYRRSR